jgi:poly-gamma-glutamate synthesis protein (capsule biosynthesis protein)
VRLALAGDTMLGRMVGDRLATEPPASLVAPEVAAACREADLVVLNLECCVSERGRPWPDPRKAFFFRAPRAAVETLVHLGVRCVTLANNHALDFGDEALLDTLAHLEAAGIGHVGAGRDDVAARVPAVVDASGLRLAIVGVSDHPEDFAAAPDRPGIAFADLRSGVPGWLTDLVFELADEVDVVLVSPHWGPNMTRGPVPHVRRAAADLIDAGVSLIAGHSAHVFHGVSGPVLYDLGDFLDDYAVDPVLRNDLGLLWFVDIDEDGPVRVEALPLKLDYRFTRLAEGEDATWIRCRFREACAAMGTRASERDDRLVVELRRAPGAGMIEDAMSSRDPEERSRELAGESLVDDDPTAWFDRLYAAAEAGEAVVPWERGAPRLLLVQWAEARGLEGGGRRALVVGAAFGDDAELVAGLGFDTVAFDIAPTAVQAARRRFPGSNVEYVVADLLAPPATWRDAFDLVVESHNVQALPDPLRPDAIARVTSFVAPGGTLLVLAAARDDDDAPVEGPPWPLTRAEVEMFRANGLEPVRIEDLLDPADPEVRRWRAEFRRA